MCQPPVVNHQRIEIPQIDRRQIARQNLLRLNIIRAPAVHVSGLRRIVEQRV